MSVYQGSPTEAERIGAESLVWKKVMRAVSYNLRVAMPGIIRTFDADTQMCTVDLTINDKFRINNKWVDVKIPTLQDVLLMLPGDDTWMITFPDLVGSECLVIAADMCMSAWWNTGDISNQEVDRRHDYSDPFAILRPRSRVKAIQNYSTDEMQLRNVDGSVVIGLSGDTVNITAPTVNVTGSETVHISGNSTTNIDGRDFLLHEHTGGTIAGNTGPVI